MFESQNINFYLAQLADDVSSGKLPHRHARSHAVCLENGRSVPSGNHYLSLFGSSDTVMTSRPTCIFMNHSKFLLAVGGGGVLTCYDVLTESPHGVSWPNVQQTK